MTTLLDEIGTAIGGIADKVGPSVVGIGRGWGVGSGVVVAEGRVLTNAHVLRRDEVTVQFAGERRETGRALGVDPGGDLAVVEVDTGDTPALEWGDPDTLVMGAPVFALANPGGRGLRVTFGTVASANRSFRGPRGRRINGALEHTAPLPRGSSGGPLVDGDGRLLGINSIRLDGGLILALAADANARARVDRLAAGEEVKRPTLGIAVAPAYVARRLRRAVGLPEQAGVLVRAVKDDSPAGRAGVERGDLIVAAGDKPVAGIDDLYTAIDAADGELALKTLRGTEEREAKLTLTPDA
ncbi:MAG: S1C family serine protease [Solirubrobacterales bacterium]